MWKIKNDLLFASDCGTLRVYMRSGPSQDDLMLRSSSSGHTWSRFSRSVETIKPFQVPQNSISDHNAYFINHIHWFLKQPNVQLMIEAETNNRGFIAIDDISLTPGRCEGASLLLRYI